MNKEERCRYYASREWALLKRQVRERSGGICERCKVGSHDQTHHLTYERFGNERLEDLQALCDACHQFLSGRSDADPSARHRLESVLRSLDRVGETIAQAEIELEDLGFDTYRDELIAIEATLMSVMKCMAKTLQ